MDTNVKTNISKLGYRVHSIEKKILGNKYDLEVALEDKVSKDILHSSTK